MTIEHLGLIFLAIIFQVFGDNMLKMSEGLRKKPPLLGVVAGYGVAFFILSKILETAPLGPVYAVWTGVGIAATAIVAAIVWKERFTASKVVGVLAIVSGVALLKLGV